MTNNNFYLDFNVTGAERKRLVQAISAYTQADAHYCGAPTFAYEVDYFHIDRNGVVSFDDRADSEEIEGLIEALVNQGFVSQVSNLGCEDDEPEAEADTAPEETEGFTVTLPKDGFTEAALDNLNKLLEAKGKLIQKALGADRLTVEVTDDHVSFPWWDRLPEPEDTQAFLSFITALCAMAKEAHRVTAKEKDAESEKYAFRCFLLRLGFIGAEHKDHRKLLLRRLSGSSAFRTAEDARKFSEAQKAKREAAKAAVSEEEPVCEG